MRVISGKLRGKLIHNPTDKTTRPLKDMVRGAIFNIISHSKLLSVDINKCIVLDLFQVWGLLVWRQFQEVLKKLSFLKIINLH